VSALDELFWRDEILQAMFWMRGEGLAESVSPAELARFLMADEAAVAAELSRLTDESYVELPDGTPGPAYRLTALGVREGGRRFQDEFAGLTQQAHGECGPGCWCQDPERQGEPCPNQPRPESERARA
jgi:hypothetical protein